MQIATIDSVATTKTLRANLRELASFCASVKGDIEQVLTYFDNNHSQIIARGDSVNGPVDILFAAYAAVPCSNFWSYIKHKHEAYTDGTLVITYAKLILLATNKYNLLKQDGSWGAKSPDEERIVAMQAELTALKGQLALGPNLKKAAAKDGKGKDTRNKKKDKKKKNKKDTSNKKNQKKDELWKKTPPKAGEPKEKKVSPKDRIFHWCHHHMSWGGHKASDCNIGKERAGCRPQHRCCASCVGHRHQPRLVSPPSQHATQHGRRMTRRPGMVLGYRCPLYHVRTTRHRSTHVDLPHFPSNSLFLAHFRTPSRHRRALTLPPALAPCPAPRLLPSLQAPQEEEHRKTAANLCSPAPSALHSPTHGRRRVPLQGWLSCVVSSISFPTGCAPVIPLAPRRWGLFCIAWPAKQAHPLIHPLRPRSVLIRTPSKSGSTTTVRF
jgi:hypothetical protein